MDIVTYALCKKLAAAAVSGIKNLTVDGLDLIIETTDGNTMTMTFPKPADGKDGKDGVDGKDGKDGINGVNGKDGVDGKDGLDGQDGISIINVEVTSDNRVLCTLSDNSVIDAGAITLDDVQDGVDGKDGISVINIQINEENHLICTLSDGSEIDAGLLPISETTTSDGLIQVATFDELPAEGKTNVTYLTLDTKIIYYYDASKKKYEAINAGGTTVTLEYATDADIDKLFDDDTTVYPDPGVQYATDEDIDKLFENDDVVSGEGQTHTFATDEDIDNLFKEEETK